jgi:HD-GYP domain-containing protein (c-di-GMP phosphodiesterase class II)
MDRRTSLYVGTIAILGALGVAGTAAVSYDVDSAMLRAAVAFCALGLVAQVSTYTLLAGAAGSIAFLPFLTASILAPSWVTAVLISASVALSEVVRRAAPIKRIFNVAQHALAASLAIYAYIVLGGGPVSEGHDVNIAAYLALVLSFLASNTLAVSGAIAISTHTRVWPVWRRNTAASIRNDVLAVPVAYCFALVYLKLSVPGVILLGVLLFGARQLYSTNIRLEKANQDLLEVMVAAIELRDPYTSGHSQRVAKFSTLIGQSMGLSLRQIDRLRVAALLHDVGKIDQRFAAILQKPGRLTDEERSIIELHPVISAELVSRVSGLADIVSSVRHHHERWDGRGYPDGISGERIPLFARIITFADTIDAMTTDRPYRRALGSAEVRSELLRNRGRQFDPSICDRLLASPLFQELVGGSRALPGIAENEVSHAAAPAA